MIKKEIDVKVFIADFKMVLPADKSKTGSQFNQKFFEVFDQFRFQFPLGIRFRQSKKIKNRGLLMPAVPVRIVA